MKLGVVTTSYPREPGDPAGSFVAGFARWLAARGHEVEVVAAGPGASRDGDIPVHRVRAGASLFYDEGAPDDRAGHRTAVLGINDWNANMIDVGVGLVRIPSPSGFGYYYIMALVLGKHQF